MERTVQGFARCNKCQAGRIFVQVTTRGYACTVCKSPKPKGMPLKQKRVVALRA